MSPHQAKRVKLVPICVVCRRQNPHIRPGESQCVHCCFWNSRCASAEWKHSQRSSREAQRIENGQRRAVGSVLDEELPHNLPSISSSQDPSGVDRALPPDHFSTQGGSRSRYIGRMFWGFADDQELNESFLYSENGSTASPSGHISIDRLDAILRFLPLSEAMLALKESFSNRVHPVHPVVDLETFAGDFFILWEWVVNMNPPPQYLKVDPTFLCLFFAVMLAGAMVMSASTWESEPRLKDLDQHRMIDEFRLACAESLIACNHGERPTLNSLVASILLQHFSSRHPFKDAAFISKIIRQAQIMGLHRELDDTSLDNYSREYRRRVWWHIVWFDVQTSLATGLPTCCGDVLNGVELPNTFRYGGTSAKYRPKRGSWQREPEQSLIMLLAIVQYGTVGLQNGFLRHFGGYSLTQQKVDDLKDAMVETARLIDRLDAMIRRFNPDDWEPEYARPIDSPMDNFVNFEQRADLVPSLFSNWVKTMLQMLKMESEILFQKGVVQLSKSKDSHSPNPRESAALLSKCHSYLQLYLDARRRKTFEPFDWFFLRQPTSQMSAMLIMQTLKNDPKAENAQEMLQAVDEFLNIRTQFLSGHSAWWRTQSTLVLKELRVKLGLPWTGESKGQSRPAAVPEKGTKAEEGLESAEAPKAEEDAEENEDVNDDFTRNIRAIFDFDN